MNLVYSVVGFYSIYVKWFLHIYDIIVEKKPCNLDLKRANREIASAYIYRDILMDYSVIFPFRISFPARICFFPRFTLSFFSVPFLSIPYISSFILYHATGTNRNFSGDGPVKRNKLSSRLYRKKIFEN